MLLISRNFAPLTDPTRAKVFVSPSGSNRNDGTEEAPFDSIAYAIDYAAKAGVKNIILRGGDYQIANPLLPKAGQSISAYPGEIPIISGGVNVTGWVVHSGNVIKAQRLHPFRQLYTNGMKALLSRGPYFKSLHWWDEPGIRVDECARLTGRVIAIAKSDYEASGSPAAGSIMVVQRDWSDNYLPVHSVQVVGEKAFIKFTAEAETAAFNSPYPYKHPDYSCHFENVPSMLAAGSWYYDDNWVYYSLRNGETLSGLEAVAPQTKTLVRVSENNIAFDGIQFGHTNYFPAKGRLAFQGDAQIYLDESDPTVPAAIEISHSSGATFRRCKFRMLGGNGIRLGVGAKNAIVQGNVFNEIAAGPITIHSLTSKAPQWLAEQNSTPIYLTDYVRVPATADESSGHSITNNHMSEFGTEYYGSCSIFISYAKNLNISNNDVVDPPYTGISFAWGWGNTESGCSNVTIQYNRIQNPCSILTDGGAFYTVGYCLGSDISYNYVSGIKANQYSTRKGNALYYGDSGTYGISISNNTYSDYEPVNATGAGTGISAGVEDFVSLVFNKEFEPADQNSVIFPVADTLPEGAAIKATTGQQPNWSGIRL